MIRLLRLTTAVAAAAAALVGSASALCVGAASAATRREPPCTKVALTAALHRGRLHGRIVQLGCAGRFAYAVVIVNAGKGEKDDVTVLFRANGKSWEIASFKYCANGSVPAQIRQPACNTN
jgi:hypothetical protein